MHLKLWQVDAFAKKPMEGNPAAVVPLEKWLPDATMQAIANENNLSETAFFVPAGPGSYHLRWFTPTDEVELCGHATLASAFVVFSELELQARQVSFSTRSGVLTVTRGHDGNNVLSLPASELSGFMAPQTFLDGLSDALGVPAPVQVHTGRMVMAVWNDPAIVRAITLGDLAPVLRSIGEWGLIATASGDNGYDFISRFFAPAKGVPEDPVTGAAHTMLTPYWARRLERKTLKARQVSARGGDLVCTDDGRRVLLAGPCALYMKGEITL
jgi:PhzF family phenazine biosynthesis protein